MTWENILRYTAICRRIHGDISQCIMRCHTGKPRHTWQIQIQRKATISLRSTLVLFGFVSTLILACLPAGLFCRPSVVLSPGHIVGLTERLANSDLVPSGLGLLRERMFFFIFYFFPLFLFMCLSFSLPHT